MNHLVPPHLTFSGLAKRLIMSSPDTPVTAVVFLDSGATGFTTDSSLPVSTMKSVFWSPTSKVTMGSRGPDISEPRQPYLISKSASPTTAGASSSFLALGHSFFQWPKAWHQAHWFGCIGPGPPLGLVEGQRRFSGRPEIDFPRAAASIVNLLSVLFRSLQLSARAQSLLNSNVSLPFLSVLTGRGGYSLGGLAGAGSWKCWPEASVTGIGACRGGGSTTSGRAGRGAAAAAGLHLALDWALRQPPILVEH